MPELNQAIMNLINLARNVAVAICAGMFLVAGYQALTSGGSPKGMETAKDTAKNAAIGMIVIFLCVVIANAVMGAVNLG